MSYRTKRPPTRSLLAFGVGVTLAITQLGAGCVPASPTEACADAAVDDGGRCVTPPDDANGRGDGK